MFEDMKLKKVTWNNSIPVHFLFKNENSEFVELHLISCHFDEAINIGCCSSNIKVGNSFSIISNIVLGVEDFALFFKEKEFKYQKMTANWIKEFSGYPQKKEITVTVDNLQILKWIFLKSFELESPLMESEQEVK